jgi:hypothetical protein
MHAARGDGGNGAATAMAAPAITERTGTGPILSGRKGEPQAVAAVGGRFAEASGTRNASQ